jgi:hypothetical protein
MPPVGQVNVTYRRAEGAGGCGGGHSGVVGAKREVTPEEFRTAALPGGFRVACVGVAGAALQSRGSRA